MDVKQEIARLELCRIARKDQFNNYVRDPEIQTLLNKSLGFLTDNDSSGIRLVVSDVTGRDSYTDGNRIVLGMLDNFFDTGYGRMDWTVVFKALLAHEVQHVNSSNFKDIERIMKLYADHMKPLGIPKETAQQVSKSFLNIMEDGRIENIIVHKLPGFRLPLLLVNNEIRRLCEPEKAADTSEPGQEFVDFQNEVLSYTLTGRHAPNMQVYAGHRLEKEFNAVKHYLDEVIDARTSADCMEICRRFLWDTTDYFAELLKSEAAQQQMKQHQQQSGNGGDEYTTNNEHEYNPGNQSENQQSGGSGKSGQSGDQKEKKPCKGKGGSEKDDAQKGAQNGGKDDSDEAGSDNRKKGQNSLRCPPSKDDMLDRSQGWTDDFSGCGPEPMAEQALSGEELAALRRGIHDELENMPDTSKSAEKNDKRMDSIKDIYAGERFRAYAENFPPIPNNPLPPEMEAVGKRMEKAFERILRQKRSEQRNLRRGTLDTRALYRVGMRDAHVFMKKGEPMKADLAVFLLMDNSGSMASCGAQTPDGNFSKSALSRKAASIVEYSLRKYAAIKISLFDVSGGCIRHNTIKKFEETTHGGKCWHSINNLGIGGGNKDGYSIRVATKELLERRESKKVLFVLSDGLPSDYNGGERAGMEDVRNAVKEARRKGILVVPVMFGDARFRRRSQKDFAYMYESFISCDPICVEDEIQKFFINLVKKS